MTGEQVNRRAQGLVARSPSIVAPTEKSRYRGTYLATEVTGPGFAQAI